MQSERFLVKKIKIEVQRHIYLKNTPYSAEYNFEDIAEFSKISNGKNSQEADISVTQNF